MITERHIDDRLHITTPYSADFVREAKRLGGKWHSAEKRWSFPPTRSEDVRAVCERIFGTRPAKPGATGVTIRITAKRDLEADRAPICFAGRPVIEAKGRDSGARPAAGCGLISDGSAIWSGGSAKNWMTQAKSGTVVEVENVNPDATGETRDWEVEIIGKTRAQDHTADLEAERRRLVARIAEIDAELGRSA